MPSHPGPSCSSLTLMSCATSSPPKLAAPPCSPRAFESVPRALYSCPATTPANAHRSGNSANAPPNCSRSRASFRVSRSSWRRCAKFCKTSTTCPRSSSLPGNLRAGASGSSKRRRTLLHLSRDRCCSATSPPSCTKGTRLWPNAARQPSRSTQHCWPSCWDAPNFASYWMRGSSSKPNSNCNASPLTARQTELRGSSTCSEFWGR